MANALTDDFFALFGIPPAFGLDIAVLEKAYREVQARVHPDRYVQLPDADRRLSMQVAARVNEGYRTLRNPLDRARYLLRIAGIDAADEKNTVMAPEFLMEQMEWREAVAEAREGGDVDELEKLHHRLSQQSAQMLRDLERQFDDEEDYVGASESVRRLMFIQKINRDIDEALEALGQ